MKNIFSRLFRPDETITEKQVERKFGKTTPKHYSVRAVQISARLVKLIRRLLRLINGPAAPQIGRRAHCAIRFPQRLRTAR